MGLESSGRRIRMGKHAVLEIENKCNQLCVFCSVDKARMRGITTEEIKKEIDALVSGGVGSLTVTGGEPTVNKELCDILKYTKKAGVAKITLQTNGILLSDKEFLDKILSASSDIDFLVSFHSADPEIYERITGVKGQYKLAIEALKNVHERCGPRLSIAIVINSLNYKHLKEEVKFLHENFPNIEFFNFIFLDPVNEAKKNSWIAVQMYLVERYLYNALGYIKENKLKAVVDRLPLCYLRGFEEYSANTMEILQDSKVAYSLLYKEKIEDSNYRHTFTEACEKCHLKSICGGLPQNYTDMFGNKELYPVFDDVEKVIKKVKEYGK